MVAITRPLQKRAFLSGPVTSSILRVDPDRRREAESAGRIVAASLNGKPNAWIKRVTDLIEACHQIHQTVETIKTSGGPSAGQNADVYKAQTQLNIGLGKYKWHPFVSGSMSAESHFEVLYSIVTVPFDQDLSREHVAVQWIVENAGVVHRIRRCRVETCRRWFYAKTDHQKYCGQTCRKKEASEGEAFKEKRRVYMKKYRREEAEREARAKQTANRLAKGKGK